MEKGRSRFSVTADAYGLTNPGISRSLASRPPYRTRPRAERRGRSVAAGLPGVIRHAIIRPMPVTARAAAPTSGAGAQASPDVPEARPMAAIAADRNLLFGLLALQNGLIDQVQLVAAFQAWTRDKARPLADHLVARGDLDADQRAAVEAPRRPAPQEARRRRREEPRRRPRRPVDPREPGRLGDPDLERHPRPASARHSDPSRWRRPRPHRQPTPSARPPPTASGSASSGPTPAAAWAPSSWPSTRSCTARWR